MKTVFIIGIFLLALLGVSLLKIGNIFDFNQIGNWFFWVLIGGLLANIVVYFVTHPMKKSWFDRIKLKKNTDSQTSSVNIEQKAKKRIVVYPQQPVCAITHGRYVYHLQQKIAIEEEKKKKRHEKK